jgi:hypothetical protein
VLVNEEKGSILGHLSNKSGVMFETSNIKVGAYLILSAWCAQVEFRLLYPSPFKMLSINRVFFRTWHRRIGVRGRLGMAALFGNRDNAMGRAENNVGASGEFLWQRR